MCWTTVTVILFLAPHANPSRDAAYGRWIVNWF
jgi:hypothetical protein